MTSDREKAAGGNHAAIDNAHHCVNIPAQKEQAFSPAIAQIAETVWLEAKGRCHSLVGLVTPGFGYLPFPAPECPSGQATAIQDIPAVSGYLSVTFAPLISGRRSSCTQLSGLYGDHNDRVLQNCN